MSRGARKTVFAILIIALLAILGFAGFRIYQSQQASKTLRAEAEAAAAAAEAETTPVPTATPTPVVTDTPTPTPTAEPTPTPEPVSSGIMISFRGDVLDEDGTPEESGYVYMLEQLLIENGYTGITVQNNTWENSGSLSQMSFAGVSEDEINAYIEQHTAAGSEDIYDLVVRDDIADYQTGERDDQDAIPVITMGFFGGWNNNPSELVEQYQKILATYNQQEKYLILGIYPNAVNEELVDADEYDRVMTEAFGDHYISMNYAVLDQPAFDDAGHQQIAQAIFNRLQSLGYLEQQADVSESESTEEETASSYSLISVDGTQVTVERGEDGTYADSTGVTYTQNADGSWTDSEGTTWNLNG